jgi:hypothetical protein
LGLAVLFSGTCPHESLTQQVSPGVRTAYFRAVGEHFGVPLHEVSILADWELTSDEIPVVLFIARSAGVSPDALVGLRRGGRGWMEVAGRFGLGAGAFRLSLPTGEPLGPLERVDQEFRNRPAREWNQIQLDDAEVIALVNVRVLAEKVGVSRIRVIRSMEEAGSFTAAYPLLRR